MSGKKISFLDVWHWFKPVVEDIRFLLALIAIVYGAVIFFWHSYTHSIEQLNKRFDRLDSRFDRLDLSVSDWFPANGLVAEFQGSSQTEIETSIGEQLSLLSDNAHGGSSVVWYERLLHDQSKGQNSDGFLRIHFHLDPNGTPNPVPYVGVFAYFSNPPKLFNISKFRYLQVKARAGPANESDCKYSIKLFDVRAAGTHKYSWPEFNLSLPVGASNAPNPFLTCETELAAIKAPPNQQETPIDLTNVFGFAIQIEEPIGKNCAGYLDIDDIRFLP